MIVYRSVPLELTSKLVKYAAVFHRVPKSYKYTLSVIEIGQPN